MGKSAQILRIVLLLLIVSLNGYANMSPSPRGGGGWAENGRPAPDSDNVKSKGGFGAQLWIVNDESFFDNWKKPETPHVPVTKRAERDKPVFIIIFFINPGLDGNSGADVVADVTITAPNGAVYGDFKDVKIWQGRYRTPANDIQLGMAHLGLTIEDTDLLGQYKIEAVVKDRIKNVNLSLKTELIAEE
jgi:hypothetical protein